MFTRAALLTTELSIQDLSVEIRNWGNYQTNIYDVYNFTNLNSKNIKTAESPAFFITILSTVYFNYFLISWHYFKNVDGI